MNHLTHKIIERIAAEGPIPFETFMEMALYEPGIGYYTRESMEIGRAGDFYTSPHLHPLFGAMIGRQIMEMQGIMGSPFHVIEMGAGMGHLCNDILSFVKDKPIFEDFSYIIVEMNPSVRKSQEALLREFEGKVSWVSSLDELQPMRGCLLSNELPDAFPVRLVEMSDDLMEVFVSWEGDRFVEVKRPASQEVRDYLSEFSGDLPGGYRTEANLRVRDWLRDLSAVVTEGFILTIDYGYTASDYYSEEHDRGTLLCYHRHTLNEDPYKNIGEQDITAHLNFSSLKKWGEELGFRTMGFCAQGTYLIALGIDEVITELYGASPDPFEIAKIKGLILPQGMGESHRVMIQYKGPASPTLRGFSFRNQARYL
ncbi:MAG: SAM-dependent methyltransferase [Thermodesulfovibrionales bacterium]|jgi:SAM-dependent MidA family methyltransferase